MAIKPASIGGVRNSGGRSATSRPSSLTRFGLRHVSGAKAGKAASGLRNGRALAVDFGAADRLVSRRVRLPGVRSRMAEWTWCFRR